jgi:hypothetical protein
LILFMSLSLNGIECYRDYMGQLAAVKTIFAHR